MLCGCGKMGQAMLHGWLDHADSIGISKVTIIDPNLDKLTGLPDHPLVTYFNNDDAVPPQQKAQVIVLACKPQDMAAAIADMIPLATADTIWLSIAAGISVEWMAEHISTHGDMGQQIIRAMPNTPSALGMGITALSGHPVLTADNRQFGLAMLNAVGEVIEVEEHLMDAVTAVSGSGPAYIFHLQEAMEAKATAMGIDADAARLMTMATIRGAAELMWQSDEPPAKLRQNVSSPGGTTLAALDHLMGDDALIKLMAKAMEAARNRSAELGK
jgi:pyrroline-5-carboxylate reductase